MQPYHKMQASSLFNVVYYSVPRSIPPVIRTNTDTWVLFKFASKERILDQIYNEISLLLTIEQFEALYDYATKDSKHDALIIFNHNRVDKIKLARRHQRRGLDTENSSFKILRASPAR
jgi:hypothetical protein